MTKRSISDRNPLGSNFVKLGGLRVTLRPDLGAEHFLNVKKMETSGTKREEPSGLFLIINVSSKKKYRVVQRQLLGKVNFPVAIYFLLNTGYIRVMY